MNKNYFWIFTTLVVLVLGVGSYAVLAERGVLPSFTNTAQTIDDATTTPPTSPATETPPVVAKTETPAKPTPPPTPVLDIKDVYDTTVAPPIRSDEPRSGTKEVTIRGELNVIKVEVLCKTKPCPQPDSSDYGFEFLDKYEPTKYKLSVRKTGDPVVRNLTDGQVYTVRGTLNYSFSNTGTPTFSFDPISIVQ